MKESKAINVTKEDTRDNQSSRNYQLYTSKVTRRRYEVRRKEAGIQCNYKRDNLACTCRNISSLKRHQEVRYFSGHPRPIYAYHGSRSFTDIGVGSVKAYQRRKVRKVYLPNTDDRGVGCSDLTSFNSGRSRNYKNSYYDHQKTSSKCVGGVIEGNAECLNEKLSPMVHTKSITTSPSIPFVEVRNVEIGSNTHDKQFVTTSTEVEDGYLQKGERIKDIKVIEVTVEQVKEISKYSAKEKRSKEVACSTEGRRRISKRAQEAERVFSSDSLVQHVHNLENPSEDKPSPMSIDLMENKLEREYRKIFCPKSKESKEQKSSEEKPDAVMKSTSILRRRFEALRRGLAKKEDSKKNAILATNESSNFNAPSHRDVSITSDPPSLEARSFSNTKMYSPCPHTNQDKSDSRAIYKKSYTGRRDWSRPDEEDSECQGVKGMFKLWGKKFNLEDEGCIPGTSADVSKKSKDSKMPATESESKKEGKKFFFFKKKSKDQTKQPYKQKKGVTAGRCEVGDGLMIKIGAVNTSQPEKKYEPKERKVIEQIPEEYEGMLRKAWLQQFLAQTIESRHSVKIRWNNKAYATSSSTVFEMMENVYKDTGVVFRSRSETTTGESSYYKSFTKQRVNFVQDIEAWMIPKFIPDKLKHLPGKINRIVKSKNKDNIEVRISDNKWLIDKSKAFAQKIEVVLHSKNIVKPCKNPSSEYLRIDIPKGFFSDSNSDSARQTDQTSNEEVYKIVEYESPELFLKNQDLNKGDHLPKDIKVTVSVRDSRDLESKILETVIKRPPIHRDVVIQGSNVHIPKRCNVIGVGIITQKDISKIRKPILKTQDDYSDEDSDETVPHCANKSKFAESYLQDYYRHWTPLGIDFFSWCVSDTHLQCCSENSQTTVNQQGDGSKSCPNIYDDYQTAMISSCGTSCCSKCAPWEDPKGKEVKEEKESKKSNFFSKFKSKSKSEPSNESEDRRILPKDSLEVFKRRKLYAASNKSKWFSCPDDKPYSVPSIDSRSAQDILGDGSQVRKPCYKPLQKKKVGNKHVSLPDCDSELPRDPTDLICPPPGILSFKGASKCDFCNKSKGVTCPKHAKLIPGATMEIPPPRMPCQEPPPKPVSPSRIPPCPPSPPRSLPRSPPPCPPSAPPCPASPPPCPPSPPPAPSSPPPCPSSPPPCPPSPPPCPSSPPPCPSTPSSCGSPKLSGIHLVARVSPMSKPSPQSTPPKPCCSPSPPSPPCQQKPSPRSTQKPGKKKSGKQKQGNQTQPPMPPCQQKTPQCIPKMMTKISPCGPCTKKRSPPATKPYSQKPSPPRSRTPSPPCSRTRSPPSSREGSPPCSRKPSPPCPRKLSPPCSPEPSPPCSPEPSPPCSPEPSPPCSPKPSPPCSPKPSPPCSPKPSPPCSPLPSPPRSPPQRRKALCPPSAVCVSPRRTKKEQGRSPRCPSPPPRNSPPRCPPRSPRSSPPISCKKPSPNTLICKSASPSSSCRNVPEPRSQSPLCSPPRTPPIKYAPCPPRPTPPPKPIKIKKCNTPPCKPPSPPRPTCDACKPCPSQEFPWPTKNQHSNQPSVSSICSDPPSSKGSKCKKDCSFHPPKCPEPKPCPRKPPCNTPPKKSGIFLKMAPLTKTCSKECSAWQSQDKSCSEDNIFINIKQGTASTEEIREGMHIKVQDEDGRTLYERCDYQKHRPSVLNDMYQTNVHTVSTPIIQNMAVDEKKSDIEQEVQDTKSEASVANLIEINFKLKVTQGDKTTEINIGNDNVAPGKPKLDTKNLQTSQVFCLKDEAEQCIGTEEVNDKNDINIKIIIKNYKPKKNNEKNQYSVDEDFNQKISNKFQTVSTGYSDTEETHNFNNVENIENINEPDKVYSVHRATIDLTSSNEISKARESHEVISGDEYTRQELKNELISSRSVTENSGTEQSDSKLEDKGKNYCHCNNSGSYYKDKGSDEKDGRHSMTDVEDLEGVGDTNVTSDEPIDDVNSTDLIPSSLTKEEKKRLLKKVFEKACKSGKMKGKDKMKQLRDMLKVILTSDSSDHEDMTVTSNELIKEMTYASLTPNYFQNTDSMNNYYQSSVISSAKDVVQNFTYPTKNESECSVQNSDVASSDENENFEPGCLCSTLAARLNMCNMNEVSGVCCCRKPSSKKTDEETCCDLRTEEDFFLLNYKTIEYIDVETQNSKFVCNSTNLSVHSKAFSGSIKKSINVKKASKILENINDMSESKNVKRTFSPRATHIRPCEMKKLNRNTMLGISDDDKVYLLNAKPTKVSISKEVTKRTNRDKSVEIVKNRNKKSKLDKPADILQCYETKKAVLEIYAEKTISNEEERLVAKLPKFVYSDESDTERIYEELPYRGLKRNVVMSVNR